MFNVSFYENNLTDNSAPRKINKFDISSLKNGAWFFKKCPNITSFTSDLSSLTNGMSMFSGCSNLTTFTSDLSSLTNGMSMFYSCSNLSTFTSNLSSLTNGYYMFYSCSNLTSFTNDLSSLTNGSYMFYSCNNLTSFTSDLNSLTDGRSMFGYCSNLTAFSSDLSSLTNGMSMFSGCSKLTSFTSNLSSLDNGHYMFGGCSELTSFTSDLNSLTYGYRMFYNCSNFTSFTSDLSSLTNGYHMFYKCFLDTESLIYIAETIKDVNGLTNGSYYDANIYKTIHIGIGSTTPTEEEKELLTEIHDKGWQVFVQCNGGNEQEFTPTSLIPIDGEETITPIPFYAKPVESDEEHADYIGEDGKYYIILGGNYILVDDPETYGLFTSEENAALNMRLTKYERSNETDEIETA